MFFLRIRFNWITLRCGLYCHPILNVRPSYHWKNDTKRSFIAFCLKYFILLKNLILWTVSSKIFAIKIIAFIWLILLPVLAVGLQRKILYDKKIFELSKFHVQSAAALRDSHSSSLVSSPLARRINKKWAASNFPSCESCSPQFLILIMMRPIPGMDQFVFANNPFLTDKIAVNWFFFGNYHPRWD